MKKRVSGMYFSNPRKISHKSDGFTLIECIISMAVFEIMFGIEVTFLLRTINNFNTMAGDNKSLYYFNETFVFIKHQIDTCLSCKTSGDNIIEITQKDNNTKNYITLNKNNNLVIYYGNTYERYNYIFRGVKEFNVKENGDVIYISIVDKEGKKYERCLGIKRKKVS